MNQAFLPIPEWHNVDDRLFKEEIIVQYRPAVLRGFVKHWPVVQHALQSPESVCRYIKSFDNGTPVNAILTRPEVQGRIFYRDDMEGFNFVRNRLPISAVVDQLMRYTAGPNPPSVAVQSALIPASLPGFERENLLTALDPSIAPRIWMGNTITVPAHVDDADNIACVVSGKRRFTLFPPDQVENLYIGPLEFNPAGAPISMVRPHDPDFERFPRYREALAHAQVADLEPGDALFIPSVWWHQVESVGTVNVLINYWWGGSIGTADRTNGPIDCLMHCLLNMRDLPPQTRAAWGRIFEHYVFGATDGRFDYIPDSKKGVLGQLSPEMMQEIKAGLVKKLQG
ncbi:MAG: cupin-like domain-containing protein [Burkholderiaceae bacterium]|nr:cupin-like domain-containing protein [Burkholderiaceae bacterium]